VDTHRALWVTFATAPYAAAVALAIYVLNSEHGHVTHRPAAIISGVLLLLSVLCLVAAVRHWRVPFLRDDPGLLYRELIEHHGKLRGSMLRIE
jgi:hypothetical protein